MIVIVSGYKCAVSSQSSPLSCSSSLDHRLQVRSEHLSWSPHPLCPGVWSDRSQADQQTGGGAHVQGGDHSQRRFSAGSTPPLPQPVLQLLYSWDLAPQPVNCKYSQGWYERLSLRLSHSLGVLHDIRVWDTFLLPMSYKRHWTTKWDKQDKQDFVSTLMFDPSSHSSLMSGVGNSWPAVVLQPRVSRDLRLPRGGVVQDTLQHWLQWESEQQSEW